MKHPTPAPPQWAWITYLTLAWFDIGSLVVLAVLKIINHVRYSEEFTVTFFGILSFGFGLVSLIAASGAIRKKTWAPHLIKIRCIWYFVASWKYIFLFSGSLFIKLQIRDDEVMSTVLFLLVFIVSGGLQIFIFRVAHIISLFQKEACLFLPSKTKKTIGVVGILLFFLGLGLKILDGYIEPQIYLITVGSYLMALGGVAFLVRHLLVKECFLLHSALSISILLYFYGPFGGNHYLTAALWAPALLIGLATFKRPTYVLSNRIFFVGVPCVLLLLVYSELIPFQMVFTAYDKPSSQRPLDFPHYLVVPGEALSVQYMQGEIISLNYQMNEPYPATKTLAALIQNIEKAGWRKLQYSLLNPDTPSAHQEGWDDIESADSVRVHVKYQWLAQWVNDKDEILDVFLYFLDPQKHTGENDMLRVDIALWKPDSWYGQELEKYKLHHPNPNDH